jgi:hypothetical protein
MAYSHVCIEEIFVPTMGYSHLCIEEIFVPTNGLIPSMVTLTKIRSKPKTIRTEGKKTTQKEQRRREEENDTQVLFMMRWLVCWG